jgi:hypothetical protein
MDNENHIHSMCCSKNKTRELITARGIQKNRKLCNRLAFPPHTNPGGPDQDPEHGGESRGINKFARKKCIPTFSDVLQGQTKRQYGGQSWSNQLPDQTKSFKKIL